MVAAALLSATGGRSTTLNQYEAMFLFDPTFGSSFENCESVIRRLMERAEAEILFCRKWDERRLAYRIKGRKRGIYVLVYFKAAPERIAPLERDARISEDILRLLVLRADGITQETMNGFVSQKAEAHAGGADDKKPTSDEPPTAVVDAKSDEPKASVVAAPSEAVEVASGKIEPAGVESGESKPAGVGPGGIEPASVESGEIEPAVEGESAETQ